MALALIGEVTLGGVAYLLVLFLVSGWVIRRSRRQEARRRGHWDEV